MKKRTSIFLAAALALLAPSLQAEPAALSWDAALSETKQHNPDLQQADEALHQAQWSELSAKGDFLPKVGLSASSSQSGAYEPQSGSLGDGSGSVGLGLNGSLNLFNGFANVASLSQAKARRVQAEAARKDAYATVLNSLRQAFYQLVYSQQQITLADTIAARAKENHDMVELRYDAGAENKGSLLQAQALASQYKYEAERARRQARSASLSLSKVLGRRPDVGLVADGSLTVPASTADPDFGALIPGVPAVMKAQAALEQAKGAKLGAWSPFLPSLNLNGGLNRSGSSWAPNNGSWSAGLSLNLNLFNGFGDILALRGADSALSVADWLAQEAADQARLDLESAWDSLVDAIAQVELSRESLEANQARAEIGRAQYAQGLMTFENWDQIETQLNSALKSELSSHLNAVTAAAAWERAQGKGFEP